MKKTTKQGLLTLSLIILFIVVGIIGNNQLQEEQVNAIINKASFTPLTQDDIKIIKESKLSEEYKNAIFEQDYKLNK